jgi:serine/threonine-protein kinase
LPGGEALLYTAVRTFEDTDIRVVDLRTGEARTLVEGANHLRYLPTGHILYGHPDQALLAVEFDARRLEVVGDPVRLIEPFAVREEGLMPFTISASGTALYLAEGGIDRRQAVLVDTLGAEEPLRLPPGRLASPRFSPDGNDIAFVDGNTFGDVIIHSLVTGSTRRLTSEGVNWWPIWSAGACQRQ